MNDYLKKSVIKANSIVDFNYNVIKSKNPLKSMFKISSPKISSKNLFDKNSKDFYNANNNINLILTKNLKSIYDENEKDKISQDTPLFENVNNLINKNKDSNRNLYNEFLNLENNVSKNKFHKKESNDLIFIKNPIKNFKIVK